jgi:hypothetical protein
MPRKMTPPPENSVFEDSGWGEAPDSPHSEQPTETTAASANTEPATATSIDWLGEPNITVPEVPNVPAELASNGSLNVTTERPQADVAVSDVFATRKQAEPSVPASFSTESLVRLVMAGLNSEAEAADRIREEISLEQGAHNLLDQVDKRYKDQLQAIAARMDVPVWNLICGIISRMGDQGTLADVALDPSWRGRIMNSRMPEFMLCEGCQRSFRPERLGQRYCCTPCGKIASGYKDQLQDHSLECTTHTRAAHAAA